MKSSAIPDGVIAASLFYFQFREYFGELFGPCLFYAQGERKGQIAFKELWGSVGRVL